MEDKKGENILLIDISEISTLADYFVICSGVSDRTIRSLAESVIEDVKKNYRSRGRIEGMPENGWVLVDFGDVIVHIFSPDQRNYYRLEELWNEGKVLVHLQ